MNAGVIWHEAYDDHDTGGHIEGPDRARAVISHLEERPIWPRLTVTTPSPATRADVELVHRSDYVSVVERTAASGGGWLDPDTYVSRRSYDIALLAVGGVLEVPRRWEAGEVPFALVRPPGHHALAGRAMGFCLFNNIAILARTLLGRGLERVAIVDWDVHHGNGTQDAFYDDPHVLFCSLHQWPHYPGTGWVDEVGSGAGEGFTVNVPLPAGSGDADYVHAFDSVIAPVVERYAPQALLVSAGQDIHVDDPLGSMRVTETGFAQLALRVTRLAAASADGHLGLVLEGGYDRDATARGVAAALGAILDEVAPEAAAPSEHGRVAAQRARQSAAPYWDL